MAYEYMRPVYIEIYETNKEKYQAWEYDETLTGVGNGDTILIPTNIQNISTTLYISSGVGKVQTTTNKLEDVLSDTGVVWVDWTSGEIAITTQDSCKPVTAIRQVNISGTTRIMLRAQ